MVKQSAVNRKIVGSSPTKTANRRIVQRLERSPDKGEIQVQFLLCLPKNAGLAE